MYLESLIKTECYGCKACGDVCPTNSIAFQNDVEGFCYPVVNKNSCVNCGLCVRCCPNASDAVLKDKKQTEEVYVGFCDAYRDDSSSGGAFSVLTDLFLSEGYIVVGASWEKENGRFLVKHTFASSKEECAAFRKSKYFASDPAGVYKKIETFLKNGNKIVFSGVPCQCNALLSYLQSKKVGTDQLVVIEVICHGAANAELFNDYIQFLQKQKGKEILLYQFKCKEADPDGKINGRRAKIKYADQTEEILDKSSDPFLWGYYSRLFYRPSCEKCKFAQPERYADITLGDAWGIEKIDPGLDPLKGVSMVIPNTEKGRAVVEATDVFGGWKKMPYSWAVASNEQLRKPTGFHMNREKFFRLRQTRSFYEAVEASKKVSFIKRVERGISRRIKKERS